MLDALARDPEELSTVLDWCIKLALFRRRARGRALESRSLRAHRAQLCEIDTRFGLLGGEGIFDALDRTGALSHRLEGLGSVEEAVDRPPREGRARVRGEAVRELAGEPSRYACSWDYILDAASGRRMDLSDPFHPAASWSDRRARGARLPGGVVPWRVGGGAPQRPAPEEPDDPDPQLDLPL